MRDLSGAGGGQDLVDLGQHLLGLAFHRQGLVVGHYARQEHQIAVHHGAGVPDLPV